MDKYHNLKLVKKLTARQTLYHSVTSVVQNGDIASTIDNIALAATADQSHMYQRMATNLQIPDTNKILGDNIKQL